MNERYTYGYGIGWDVENEYINSIKYIMNDYTAQMEKIYGEPDPEVVSSSIPEVEADAIRNSNITEEQIRQWYEEDYAESNSLISYEKYRQDILDEIERKKKDLMQEGLEKAGPLHKGLEKNSDEYFANLRYLIDIKELARKEIHKQKNRLELLLSEKKLELSYINLETRKTEIQYDEQRRILNSEEFQQLRKRYDDVWLEIRKIEHALEKLNEMFALMEFTKEEFDLMMRGLNPQQRKIYDELDKITSIDPEESEKDPNGPENNPTGTEGDPEDPEIDPDGPEMDPQKEEITLDGIIYKVCGEEEFNDKQSSKYQASKIKIFSKPQKDNYGMGYKIVSIPRRVIGIIPKTAMKLYGMFLTPKTKNIFKGMEERANNLTDREVEILLEQYKGAVAQSKRIPKGFNNAVRPRVNLYVAKKVAKINEEINQKLIKINYCEKVINVLKEKQQVENDPTMLGKIDEVLETAYGNASMCIKDLISLQIEGNSLQNGNGLHSFEEELKALDTKMNYVGGRFSKSREYDPELWSKVSGLSQKIEYSLDPREVVDSYLQREQIYIENSKEKRSIANLGSKVTAGKLDYRPFVESLNYGNDPFIRDLITSIMVISSAASMVNSISTSLKLKEVERVGTEQQKIIEEIRNNGQTIEKGITYDIKQTEGAMENLAERGVNDQYGWNLSGSNYVADDAAHHLETANISIQNTSDILDLSNKFSSGQITYAEMLRGLQQMKQQTTQTYETYVSDLSSHIEQYAMAHPQFDYTAVLSALKHAANNPGDSVELTEFITDIYEKSLNVTDFNSLDLIQNSLTTSIIVPNLITLGAVTAKVGQEQIDTTRENKPDSKKQRELRDLIESLKSMKAELTEEEVKEIENLISR